ncbi:unnamed protein product [Ectocarpus fasciculatus]
MHAARVWGSLPRDPIVGSDTADEIIGTLFAHIE